MHSKNVFSMHIDCQRSKRIVEFIRQCTFATIAVFLEIHYRLYKTSSRQCQQAPSLFFYASVLNNNFFS